MAWETTIVVRTEREPDEQEVRRLLEDNLDGADVQEYETEEV